MTQDGPEAQTWTDFEEDCDAVNQARASKINDSVFSAYQRVLARNPPQMEDAIFGVWRRPRRSETAADRRIGTGTVDDCETPCPTGKSSLGPQTSMETSPAPHSETPQGRTARWTTPLVWRRGASAANKPTTHVTDVQRPMPETARTRPDTVKS